MKSFALGRAGSRAFLLLFTLLFTASPALAQTEVVRASATYRDSRQFFRISEFFTNRENTGSDIVVRSREDERAGYYFTVRLKKYPYRHDAVEEAVHLEVIMPGDVEPTLFTFPLGPSKRKNPLILIGLTGADWPDASALPLAWRISFLDGAGAILAQERSFLWSIEE
jgi:hypothetical protein